MAKANTRMAIRQRLVRLEAAVQMAPMCGGTFSSAHLVGALALRKQILTSDCPNEFTTRVNKIISVWREVLSIHNEQAVKFIEYDTLTGLPKGES